MFKLSTTILLFLLHDWQADWIMELANQNSTIIGVIGWVDLTDPKVDKFTWEYYLTNYN